MTLVWYQWAILGILLIATELLVPAFVLVWFGLGALAVAVLLALVPSLPFSAQSLIWLAVSIALVGLWFKVFKPGKFTSMVGRSSAGVIGEKGLLVSDVEPFQKGQVRFQKPLIGSDLWTCVADEAIKAGSRVKITKVEGSILTITRTED